MLSKFDDFPIHQTPEPVAHPASNDRNVYDRYWFNGFTADGSLYFGIALGLYPNRDILDCAFSVVHAGTQHAFYASRRSPAERGILEAGPFRIEVVEPMRTLRVTLAPNDSGIACDLVFHASTAAIEEDRQMLKRGHRVFMDVTRFAQFGRWEGRLEVAGTQAQLARERTFGTRDRSWGIRPVGEPESGGAPSSIAPQLFFLWAPIHWQDACTHLCIFEDADGRPLNAEGKWVPLHSELRTVTEDPGIRRARGVAHRITYQPGTRRMTHGEFIMLEASGERTVIDVEPLLTFRMKGIGYRHPTWSHGRWHGELALGHDRWESDALDPLAIDNVHIQQLVRARTGDRVGYGIVEQLCLGPHAPSGFTGFLDGARD